MNSVKQTPPLSLGQTRCLWDSLAAFGTDSLSLGQTRCLWDRLAAFGTDSLAFGQTRCLWDRLTEFDMGLINKVDMVCLSPVGYGV